MSCIKWIKLSVDMFDNRKVKYIRHLPEGDSIILIWVMLLTMAGRCNAGGMIFLTENIPYTAKMLADELDMEQSTIELAITALSSVGMISLENDFMRICDWEEHQNIDGMEKVREQNRLRKQNQRSREKEKQLVSCVSHDASRDSNVTVTQCHETDIDIEEEIDIKEKEKEKEKPQKRKRFKPPTTEEVLEYAREKGYAVDADRFIAFYDSNGWKVGKNPMKDWKAAVRTWHARDGGKSAAKKGWTADDFSEFD